MACRRARIARDKGARALESGRQGVGVTGEACVGAAAEGGGRRRAAGNGSLGVGRLCGVMPNFQYRTGLWLGVAPKVRVVHAPPPPQTPPPNHTCTQARLGGEALGYAALLPVFSTPPPTHLNPHSARPPPTCRQTQTTSRGRPLDPPWPQACPSAPPPSPPPPPPSGCAAARYLQRRDAAMPHPQPPRGNKV